MTHLHPLALIPSDSLPLNDRFFKWSKLDSEPSRHPIAFSPDLGSATESDLNTDRSEPELRQTSALSSVTEDEPKPTEQWQSNPEYNQVKKCSEKFFIKFHRIKPGSKPSMTFFGNKVRIFKFLPEKHFLHFFYPKGDKKTHFLVKICVGEVKFSNFFRISKFF